MKKTLPLLEHGLSRGMAERRDEGCYAVFTIDVPQWGSGLKKVWLASDSGGRMLLGTLQPELHRFRLCRRVSLSALRCCGMTEPSAALVNPGQQETVFSAAPEGWHTLDTLHGLGENTLTLLKRESGGIWKQENGHILVRYPWRVGDPLPAVSLFRHGTPKEGFWELDLTPAEPPSPSGSRRGP